MPQLVANSVRVFVGVLALFVAYAFGGYVGAAFVPDSTQINKMEMLSDKIGASIAIMLVSVLLKRFLFLSFGMALVCLVVTELVALSIVLHITGLPLSSRFDITFNFGWLYAMTWNVVVAFLFGSIAGHVWYHWAATGKHRNANGS